MTHCPYCNDERETEKINEKETIEVRGEEFAVDVEFYRCAVCGGEYERGDSDVKPVEAAYRLYREKHGMVRPGEIRDFRRRYHLTQRELGDLLGWGGATLSRYENGALQDDAHDRMLRLVMEPSNLLDLVERNEEALPPEKKTRLVARLGDEMNASTECPAMLDRFDRSSAPDIFNGYRRFDIERMKQAILFFTRSPRFKTVLNKLLYYADFLHFKREGISITGARYVHLPYGPVPDNYRLIFDAMAVDGEVSVEEVFHPGGDYGGETYRAVTEPDLDIFSRSEREALHIIETRFAGFTAKRISDVSHEEEGYKRTRDGEAISYGFAGGMEG